LGLKGLWESDGIRCFYNLSHLLILLIPVQTKKGNIMKRILFIITLCLIFNSSSLFSQQSQLVDVTGEAYLEGDKTVKEVQNEALQNARKKAIELVAGVSIRDRIMVIERSDDPVTKAASLTESFSAGRIIEEKDLIWKTESKVIDLSKPPVVIYRVKLKARVVKDFKRENTFALNVELNQQRFYSGDDIRIKIKPTEDCYISVINFASDNKVYVLFPNPFQRNNFVERNEEVIIPSDADMMKGIKYAVYLPDGINRHIEVIKVIGVKHNNPLRALEEMKNSVGGYKIFSSVTDLTDFNKWILSLPEGDFSEEDVHYTIIRK